MSKTIIAVRHFGLGGRESLETAVIKEGTIFIDLLVLMKYHECVIPLRTLT